MLQELLPTFVLYLLVVPLGGAIFCAVLGRSQATAVRWSALLAVVVNLALAGFLAWSFVRLPVVAEKGGVPTFEPRIEFHCPLLRLDPAGAAVQFFVGLDGLNVWLILLTALLMVSAVLISWKSITERTNEYYAWLLALETAMIGVFLAFDILLFYTFFELTLVPLFFLIGIWGGPQRQHAARKFFIYTLAGSLITFLGVLGVVYLCYTDKGIQELTFSIPRLVFLVNSHLTDLAKDPVANEQALTFWRQAQFWVFVALMVGFAVKVPLVPLHTWLPLAHVEAPTAGSVLLAGVLLKIGTYGFLRLCVPLAPEAAISFGVPLLGTLAVIGIIYGALCALAQDDIKKLVAYSSVSHLGFCVLGIFALNEAGLAGGLLQMINHGLSTGALFLLVGMLYERYHTRKLVDYGGMAARLKLLSCFMIFICLTSIGLPGLNGFIGEILVLMGAYDLANSHASGPVLATLAATGVVLGAWYLLTMVRKVFFGPLREPPIHDHGPVGDINVRELAALVPIALCCLVIGLYPQPILDASRHDLHVVSQLADQAKKRGEVIATAIAEAQHDTPRAEE